MQQAKAWSSHSHPLRRRVGNFGRGRGCGVGVVCVGLRLLLRGNHQQEGFPSLLPPHPSSISRNCAETASSRTILHHLSKAALGTTYSPKVKTSDADRVACVRLTRLVAFLSLGRTTCCPVGEKSMFRAQAKHDRRRWSMVRSRRHVLL